MTKIYCKNEEEMARLQTKYPNVEAEWKTIPEDRAEIGSPLVCDNNEPLEMCPLGESHIARLSNEAKKTE